MAEKKATKRKRKNQTDEAASLTKDEEKVAKYLRFNLESKKSTLLGDEAYYFFGSKAVDFLMDSKWATGYKSSVAFTHRESVVAFLNKLLGVRYFDHVHVKKTEKKVKMKDGEKKEEGDKKRETDKKKTDKTKGEEKENASPRNKREKDGKESKKVKKKVKINLEPHEDQFFFDSDDEAYVWIYDPVSWKTFFFGVLLVLAIIAVCLFPLWPENVREYSWYLSVAGAIFVGGILVLAILRYVIYGILWLGTVGKLHFWLLPNLTAECGFFESFVPVYEYSFVKSEKVDKEDDEGENKEKCGSDGNDVEDLDQIEGEPSKDTVSNKLCIGDDTENSIESVQDVDTTTSNEVPKPNIVESDDDDKHEVANNDIVNDVSSECSEIVSNKNTVENITDDLAYVDKLENESEESNDSVKEEDWVKVKKHDADDNLSKNENEVKC